MYTYVQTFTGITKMEIFQIENSRSNSCADVCKLVGKYRISQEVARYKCWDFDFDFSLDARLFGFW